MMKRILIILGAVAMAGFLASGALAYTANDPSNDGIGSSQGYESYGINVLNYTPGSYTGGISFQLFTDYPQAGITTGSWVTTAADLFITETYYGNSYLWAIPLVNHDTFIAGTMYAVGTYKVSDDFEPAGGGYTYNHNVSVEIATVGNNYGNTYFGGGSVTWTTLSGNPNYQVDVVTGVYQDDPDGKWCLLWGTSTCANDVVQGCVPAPIPGAVWLLGSGLLGLVGVGIRRKSS
jgi:hypothetical protein